MNSIVAGLLAIAVLACMAAGAISIIVPLRFLGIRTRGRGFLLVLAGVVALVLIGYNMEPGTGSQRVALETSSKPLASLPADERGLIAAVATGRATYAAGANDMAKGAARPQRSKAVCQAVSGSQIQGWIGTIDTLSSNSDGKGVLKVAIAKDVTIGTWNNGMSDTSDRTLLEPSSEIFRKAAALSVGQVVKFSATLIPSDVDCIRETSMTLSGSIDSPSYVARFLSIEAVN